MAMARPCFVFFPRWCVHVAHNLTCSMRTPARRCTGAEAEVMRKYTMFSRLCGINTCIVYFIVGRLRGGTHFSTKPWCVRHFLDAFSGGIASYQGHRSFGRHPRWSLNSHCRQDGQVYRKGTSWRHQWAGFYCQAYRKCPSWRHERAEFYCGG